MNVLVINCGSSSLKYQLINSDTEDVLAKGLCERIGIDGRLVYQKAGLDKEITECAMPTHKEAIQFVLDALTNEKTGAIKSLKEVDAIGHRVVHGGEKFAASAVITDEMIAAVKECNDLAPLHNPANPLVLITRFPFVVSTTSSASRSGETSSLFTCAISTGDPMNGTGS